MKRAITFDFLCVPICFLVSCLTVLGFATFGQAPTPKYQPTEIQLLRLQVLQRDAQIAQMQFYQKVAALQAEGQKVKTENKWPADVRFNPDTLTFEEAPPPPPPKEEKKP
jgi:hypothetical protein